MIRLRRRKVGFALTGLLAAAGTAVVAAAVVLDSTPASACYSSTWPVQNCDGCAVDGGSAGKDGCDILYAAGRAYCEAVGGDCYSD